MTSFKLVGILVLLAGVALGSDALAHKNEKNCNFLPKNHLSIPVGANEFTGGGLDQKTFNQVIDKVSSFYAPLIAKKGGVFKVNRLWNDATVNASATRSGNQWIVNMYGGLARQQRVTADAFTVVLCHEIGHQLGGYPRRPTLFGWNSWAANEGQADYFAVMKCTRRVWEHEDNEAALKGMVVPAIVQQKCSSQLKSQNEILVCERSAMAGMTLGLLLWDLSSGGGLHDDVNDSESRSGSEHSFVSKSTSSSEAPPRFETPSHARVSMTDNAHPETQCRVDTYFNGSICGSSFHFAFGQNDPMTGACSIEHHDSDGYRPLCWYKPKY